MNPDVGAGRQGDLGPLRRFADLMLVQVDLAHHRDDFALLEVGNGFTLEPGLAAHIQIFRRHFRGSGHQRDRRLLERGPLRRGCFLGLAGAAFLDRLGGRCRRRCGRNRLRAGAVIGAGMAGIVFVLCCATAAVAANIPKINQ